MAELKLCPFCGGKAKFNQTKYGTADASSVTLGFRIECKECSATAPKSYGLININLDESGNLNAWQDDREKAISSWNRRAGEDD